MLVEARNYLVRFSSILLDYVLGLVVRSCRRLMEGKRMFAALNRKTYATSVEAALQFYYSDGD